MLLLGLRAENYRNIERVDISFEKGVNLLFGENAQGKTNALECIYSFARGKSFRQASDADLVRFGSEGFSAEISFRNKERDQTLAYRFSKGERRRERNGIVLTKQSDMIGHFRAVLFYPEHLQLIKGGPAERRGFLNSAISQCYPVYLKLYADYTRILENRNCLLKLAQKGMPCDAAELMSWSEALAQTATKIHLYRKKYVSSLETHARLLLRHLSGERESLSLFYESDTAGETEEELRLAYFKALSEDVRREIMAGCTMTGVHRDDLGVNINGISARSFASQGQQRSIVLALKLAEGEVSREITGDYPVFLFDDVLSELDEGRRAYVLSDPGERQFILTACETSGFNRETVRMIPVSGGCFGGES